MDQGGVLMGQIFWPVGFSRQSVKSFRSHSNETENYTHTKLVGVHAIFPPDWALSIGSQWISWSRMSASLIRHGLLSVWKHEQSQWKYWGPENPLTVQEFLCMTTKLREWCVVNASKNHRASVSYINNKLPLLCSVTPHIILQRSNRWRGNCLGLQVSFWITTLQEVFGKQFKTDG